MGKHLGTLLRDARNRKQLTLEQLGKKLGCSRQAISRWERGDATPDSDSSVYDILGLDFKKVGAAVLADFNEKRRR